MNLLCPSNQKVSPHKHNYLTSWQAPGDHLHRLYGDAANLQALRQPAQATTVARVLQQQSGKRLETEGLSLHWHTSIGASAANTAGGSCTQGC